MRTINNDFNNTLIKKNLDQKGLYTVRNFIEKKIINQIKIKVLKNLNKKKKIIDCKKY